MKLFRAKTTHPWEKNSPVFENRDYLNLVYEDLMKNQYIKTASASSRVMLNIFYIKIKPSVFLNQIILNLICWRTHNKIVLVEIFARNKMYHEIPFLCLQIICTALSGRNVTKRCSAQTELLIHFSKKL